MHSSAATTTPDSRKPFPGWAKAFYERSNHLLFDLGGGRRTLPLDQAINIQKVITVFFIYGLMHWYGNFSVGAWVYLGLHGAYGYTWLIKDRAFPNTAFQGRITIGSLCLLLGGLNIVYWSLPWLFISRAVVPSGELLFAAIFIHTLGVALMAAADVQKNCTLRYRKGLITDGVFSYTRNPNYLGEMMIYGSYALLVAHWFGYLVIVLQFFCLFLPRMLAKDASISRYPGWAEYERRSGLLLPWGLIRVARKPSLAAEAPGAEPSRAVSR